jgi:hypothetical protein
MVSQVTASGDKVRNIEYASKDNSAWQLSYNRSAQQLVVAERAHYTRPSKAYSNAHSAIPFTSESATGGPRVFIMSNCTTRSPRPLISAAKYQYRWRTNSWPLKPWHKPGLRHHVLVRRGDVDGEHVLRFALSLGSRSVPLCAYVPPGSRAWRS